MDIGDDSYDVPDSTDWLGTPLACLMPVEQAFRCHVCKDFFNSPMLTSCSHTFCSLCIRRCLSVDGKCPLCRMPDQESKLRGNWAMREAVDAFVKSRSTVLDLARVPPSNTVATPASPKRKAEELGDEAIEVVESKRTRTSARLSKTRAAEATAAFARDEIDVPEARDSMDFEPDDGLVACPICLTRMKPFQVDRHLDTSCPGSPQPQGTSASSAWGGVVGQDSFGSTRKTPAPAQPAKAPERLPPLNYSMLKDQALRKKMNELGISTTGTRQQQEKRHKEWVTIWNANCDSARPKKRLELIHDLEVWERTLGSRAPVMSKAAAVGSQIKDKEFDGAAWAVKHDASFQDLIANARRTRRQADEKAQSAAEEPSGPNGKHTSHEMHQTTGESSTPSLRLLNHEVVDLTGSSPSTAIHGEETGSTAPEQRPLPNGGSVDGVPSASAFATGGTTVPSHMRMSTAESLAEYPP